jgi:hypothetical protein
MIVKKKGSCRLETKALARFEHHRRLLIDIDGDLLQCFDRIDESSPLPRSFKIR